jgi:hypothetical protein
MAALEKALKCMCAARILIGVVSLLWATLEVIAEEPSNSDWIVLFNGKNLDGWIQRGGTAKFHVEDGQIVGTSAPGNASTFLCTKRDYSDFVLELEFKIHEKLNSGVQIRSQCFDEPKVIELGGKKVNIPAGRVHGYQVEIDPSPRAWTAGIYDAGRRGWLYDLKKNEPARKAFKANDWNKLRIQCKGDSIKTWLNGVLAADLKDSVTSSGFVGLQVHGVSANTEPMEVRFRDLRLKELK